LSGSSVYHAAGDVTTGHSDLWSATSFVINSMLIFDTQGIPAAGMQAGTTFGILGATQDITGDFSSKTFQFYPDYNTDNIEGTYIISSF
jgi:hypothetical protein